jgi:RecA/RadA recombinase
MKRSSMLDLRNTLVKKRKHYKMTTSDERSKKLEAALAKINKDWGANSVMKLGDRAVQEIEVIPSGSLAIDMAMGVGGLPKGRIIEIYGPESSGKTLFTLQAIAEAQKAGGTAAFVDAEHALDPIWAKKIGVNTDELIISQPDNGEQAFEIAETLIRSQAVDILVIDSVAALVPKKELEGDMGDAQMGIQARLMSQGLRKITAAIHNTNTVVIFINQLRSKIGVVFGCFQYSTKVVMADGTTKEIGDIVNQRIPAKVMSYNPKTGLIEPKKIVNWFDNGDADKFLEFSVAKSDGNGVSQFSATENHSIATLNGYEAAGDLKVGDIVMTKQRKLSSNGEPEAGFELVGNRILDITVKPQTRSMRKFDIEIEGNHNYFVDEVMVHNSPEVTTGGKALAYYATIRIDIRRIGQIKEGENIIGARTKVKIIKNKVAPPFKVAEFDILYTKGSEGYSRQADIRDLGVELGIIRKSGSWFTYDNAQLGQGGEKVRIYLKENPEIAQKIEDEIKAKLYGGEVSLAIEPTDEEA